MKKIIIAMAVLCAAALGYYAVKTYLDNAKYDQPGFAYGNGRLQATEVSIATKLSGRIEEIYADEGDFVHKGDKLALMQLNVLNAELAQAKARKIQAEAELSECKAQVEVKRSELASARAFEVQKQVSCDNAAKRLAREEELMSKGASSAQRLDDMKTNFLTARADLDAAKADTKEVEASIHAVNAAVAAANANIQAAQAEIDRVQADIDDSLLISPIKGRVQYRVAEPGEVLDSGKSVLNLVDLTDVYMTFFLPETIAGKVMPGAEARIVLDVLPDTPIPAKITFVSSEAQFTPKTVETREERQKLMFRVKAKVDPELLEKYIDYIKTGLPGEAWVQLDPDAPWPDFLALKREREQKQK